MPARFEVSSRVRRSAWKTPRGEHDIPSAVYASRPIRYSFSMSSSRKEPSPSKVLDLEIKDARVIFNPIWESLEEEVGRVDLRFPKEIILLGGAPGAGKGTQTPFISAARGLTCPPVVISDLLTTPEMEKLKAQGVMVGDKEVLSVLLRKLLDPI